MSVCALASAFTYVRPGRLPCAHLALAAAGRPLAAINSTPAEATCLVATSVRSERQERAPNTNAVSLHLSASLQRRPPLPDGVLTGLPCPGVTVRPERCICRGVCHDTTRRRLSRKCRDRNTGHQRSRRRSTRTTAVPQATAARESPKAAEAARADRAARGPRKAPTSRYLSHVVPPQPTDGDAQGQ